MMFFKRVLAYLIDCIILFFAITLVNLFIPINGSVVEANDKLIDLMGEYTEQKITIDEFNEQTQNLNYTITKGTYISTIASIVIYILYFVVFQAYNSGQTLGKKLFKIQVLKEDDKQVDINTMLIRCLIPYGILVNFILVVMILFVGKNFYINASSVLNSIHTIVIFVTLFMMVIKSKGIHDYLSKTKVVKL